MISGFYFHWMNWKPQIHLQGLSLLDGYFFVQYLKICKYFHQKKPNNINNKNKKNNNNKEEANYFIACILRLVEFHS